MQQAADASLIFKLGISGASPSSSRFFPGTYMDTEKEFSGLRSPEWVRI